MTCTLFTPDTTLDASVEFNTVETEATIADMPVNISFRRHLCDRRRDLVSQQSPNGQTILFCRYCPA